MIKPLSVTCLFTTSLAFAQLPEELSPLQISKNADQVEESRVSLPLVNQARKALLLFEKLSDGKDFCILQPHQAMDLAGESYKEIKGLKPILVKWKFLEPVDKNGVDTVWSHPPRVYSKGRGLHILSSGIDIGNIGKTTEGVLIIQVSDNPSKVVLELRKEGW